MRESLSRQKALKRLTEMEKKARINRVGPADNLDALCDHFMKHIRKEYSGHKAEISPQSLTRIVRKFHLAFGVNENQMLDALMRRGFLEPSAADTYLIRYDLAR